MFGRKKAKAWKTPGGPVYNLYADMAKQPHLLVAGATGSGKSVLVNGIIATLLHDAPCEKQFILLDPKRTELIQYSSLPHTICYATEEKDMIAALQMALDITESRYKEMQRRHEKLYSGSDIYVIIDELAFLMTSCKKQALPLLQKLGMIARASKIHLMACTQSVKADILPTTLTCNFDSRVALRTSTAQQSRMIVDVPGCERFPAPVIEHKAWCYYKVGADITLYNVPLISESEIDFLIKYWSGRDCVA